MTITENPPEAHAVAPAPGFERRPAASPSGLAGWVLTDDHKRIGRMYLALAVLVVIAALVVGALLALERIEPARTQILPLDTVPQLFSFYRTGLVFMGVLPLLLGLAIAVVPLQLGATAIAFPRAAALSFWGWLIGGGLLIGAYFANGGPGGGQVRAVDLFLLSLGLVVASLLVGSMCVVATALTMRAPGMTLGRMPFLAWSAVVTGSMLLVSLPVLVGNLIVLYVNHHYGGQLLGGDQGMASILEWSISQPQVYVYALLGLGVVADIVPVMARIRQPLRFTVMGALGVLGALSFGAYVQPALWPKVTQQFLYVVTNLAVVLPVVALLGLWAMALGSGRVRFTSALLFSVGASLMYAGGAVAGVFTPWKGLSLRGTVFVLGQFNFVLLAGLLGTGAAVLFWGPKLWGRRVHGGPARALAVVAFLGVVLTALPEVILGFFKQPLGEVNYSVDHEGLAKFLNAVSFGGYVIMALTVLTFVALAGRALARRGERIGDDPWDGQTLEWATTSPPPVEDFDVWVGEVTSPEPLLDRKEAAQGSEV